VTLTSRKSRVAVKCRVRRHASFTCGSEVIYCYTYLTRYPQYSTAQWSECIARSDRLFNMTLQHALASMNVTLASAYNVTSASVIGIGFMFFYPNGDFNQTEKKFLD